MVNFLLDSWATSDIAPFIGNKIIYVNYESCFKYEKIGDNVIKSLEENLSCKEHDESDTKIIFHACQTEEDSHVVLRCLDTDISIIMLDNMKFLKENVKI